MTPKDWTGTSESAFKQLGASNHCSDDREENDYYATDPRAVDELLKYESLDHNLWECASGGGHITNKLKDYGYNVYSTDLIDRGHQDKIIDFLKCNEKWQGDIITNPPYKYCTSFILRALSLINEGNKVAFFLKLTTLESADRYEKVFSKYSPRTIYVFSKRIQCAKNGEFKGSSAVCYAWFVWVKGFKGNPEIKWIY